MHPSTKKGFFPDCRLSIRQDLIKAFGCRRMLLRQQKRKGQGDLSSPLSSVRGWTAAGLFEDSQSHDLPAVHAAKKNYTLKRGSLAVSSRTYLKSMGLKSRMPIRLGMAIRALAVSAMSQARSRVTTAPAAITTEKMTR